MNLKRHNHLPLIFWSTLLIYVACIIIWSYFHEVWRDEVLPVSLVTQSSSLPELFANIRNYGHPSLWFVLLYAVYQIFPSYVILKVVNIIIALFAAYIFLSKAPFVWWQRILFLLGYFPFYYFPVVNRMYGLCWLLFLCCCVLFSKRWQQMVILSIVLFLLANTHVEGLIISIAVALTLGLEFIFCHVDILKRYSLKTILVGAAVIAVGISISVIQLKTDSSSVIMSQEPVTLRQIFGALKIAVFAPGEVFRHILGGEHVTVVTALIMGCYFLLRRHWVYLSVLFFSTVGLGLFFRLIFPGYDLYHESFMYMLIIFAFWHTSIEYQSKKWVRLYWNLAFTLILMTQVFMAYQAIRADVGGDFSSSRKFAGWIKAQPQGEKYVLVGEPDYLINTMPYYVANEIYLTREQRYGKVEQDTLLNKQELSLEELLATAQRLKAQGKDVLLVIGHELKKEGPFEIKFSYNKIFRYSPQSLADWEEKVEKVVGFHGSYYNGGENYNVFRLK